ncbi:MAG: neutral/alkaline non-lysosomal ceramidase N-terminal domain-containing protein [Candidatus Hydrogenedentota bacterium]
MKLSVRNLVVCLSVGLAVVVCLSPVVSNAAEADTPVFRAGAAVSNITPPLGSEIVGNWGKPLATHIHDELHVRCLVLDDGERRLALAVCDNLSIDREVYDQAKKRLEEKTGIAPAHMLMSSVHTHSGPSARQRPSLTPYDDLTEYQQFVADRIVDGVQCAINNLEPAQVGWGSGEEPDQVFNRRWHMDDPSLMVSPYGDQDQVRMNPPRGHEALVKPAGPTDPEIVFLTVRSVDGRPIALLANYSLHYVGGVPRGHISADYFAVFADRIQELLDADRLDPPFVGILSNGTSGDINNINFREPRPKREPYEQIHRVANSVAGEVYRAIQTVAYHDYVKLGGRMTALSLDVRKPDEATREWAHDILEKPEDEVDRKARIYANRALALHESPDQVDIWVQALRIGEVGIAGIPFEVFAETGLRIKEESPLPVAFTISFANGGYGYLPTPAQHALGGYEAWLGSNRVEENSEPAIVDTLLEQLGELAEE